MSYIQNPESRIANANAGDWHETPTIKCGALVYHTPAWSVVYLSHKHSLTHSLTLSLTHSLTHSLHHSLTHSLTHARTRQGAPENRPPFAEIDRRLHALDCEAASPPKQATCPVGYVDRVSVMWIGQQLAVDRVSVVWIGWLHALDCEAASPPKQVLSNTHRWTGNTLKWTGNGLEHS